MPSLNNYIIRRLFVFIMLVSQNKACGFVGNKYSCKETVFYPKKEREKIPKHAQVQRI